MLLVLLLLLLLMLLLLLSSLLLLLRFVVGVVDVVVAVVVISVVVLDVGSWWCPRSPGVAAKRVAECPHGTGRADAEAGHRSYRAAAVDEERQSAGLAACFSRVVNLKR